ncbi:hypothetical protein KFE25_002854 [Diacronema lutheri]|uniref:SEC7 domain-containing protein n=2 Tax=Diacronema lutheri TaxID=2081491 RepID=A0A8J6C8N3_DIALT|nr:hypothetical protein KFE25_002854 [Diacronema lutheri]
MRQHEYPVHAGVEGACARLVASGSSPEAVSRALAAVLADTALDEEEPPFAVDIVPNARDPAARGLACELRVTPSGVIFLGSEAPRRLDELHVIVMLGGAFQPGSGLERARRPSRRSRSPSPGGSRKPLHDDDDDAPYGVQLRWLDGSVHTLRARHDETPGLALPPDDDGASSAGVFAEQLQELFEAHLVRFAHMRAALLLALRRCCGALRPASEADARAALDAQLAAVWMPLGEAGAAALSGAAAPEPGRAPDAAVRAAGAVVAAGTVGERMRLLGFGAEAEWAPLLAADCQRGAPLLGALSCLAHALAWARARGRQLDHFLALLHVPAAGKAAGLSGARASDDGDVPRQPATPTPTPTLGAAAVYLACVALQACALAPLPAWMARSGGALALPAATQLLLQLSQAGEEDGTESGGVGGLSGAAQRPPRVLAAAIAARASVLSCEPLAAVALLCDQADVALGAGVDAARARASGEASSAAPSGLLPGLFANALDLFVAFASCGSAGGSAGGSPRTGGDVLARALAATAAHVGAVLAPPARGAESGGMAMKPSLSLSAAIARLHAVTKLARQAAAAGASVDEAARAGLAPDGGIHASFAHELPRNAHSAHSAGAEPPPIAPLVSIERASAEEASGDLQRTCSDGSGTNPHERTDGEADADDGDGDSVGADDARGASVDARALSAGESDAVPASAPGDALGLNVPLARRRSASPAELAAGVQVGVQAIGASLAERASVLRAQTYGNGSRTASPPASLPSTPRQLDVRRSNTVGPPGRELALPSAVPPFNYALRHGAAVEAELRAKANIFNAAGAGKKGIKQLIERGLIGSSPEAIGAFLREAGPRLRQRDVADYLGSEGSADALAWYVASLDLAELRIDSAVRKLNTSIQLKVEAQKIDRILTAFAKRYHECNPGLFESEDKAYVTSYSLMMLNTDAHNDKVKSKMSKDAFVAMNREQNLPRDLLEALYENVTSCDLQIEERSQVDVVKEGWLLKQNRRKVGWKWRYCLLSSRALYVYKQQDDLEPAFFCPLEYSAISQVQPNGALSKKLEIRSLAEMAGSVTPRLSRARSQGGSAHGPEAGRTMIFEARDEREAKEWLRSVQQFTLQEGILVVPLDELEAWEQINARAGGAPIVASRSAPLTAGASLSPRPQLPMLRASVSLSRAGSAHAGLDELGALDAVLATNAGSSLRERRALAKAQQLAQRERRPMTGAPAAPGAGDETKALIERYYGAMEQTGARGADGTNALVTPSDDADRRFEAERVAPARAPSAHDGDGGGGDGGGNDQVDGSDQVEHDVDGVRHARSTVAPLVAPLGIGISKHASGSDDAAPMPRHAPHLASADSAGHAADTSSQSSATPSPRFARRSPRDGGAHLPSVLATHAAGASVSSSRGASPLAHPAPSQSAPARTGADAPARLDGFAAVADADLLMRRRLAELRLLEEEMPSAANGVSLRERAAVGALSVELVAKRQQLDDLERALRVLEGALAERTATLRSVSEQVTLERARLSSLRMHAATTQPAEPSVAGTTVDARHASSEWANGDERLPGAAAAAAVKAAAAAAAASASATSAAAARHGMTGAHSASTWSGAAWPGANARAESTADPARAHGARVWTNGAAEALTSDGDGVSLSRALAPLNASAPSRQLDRPGVRPGSSFSAHAPRSEPSAALLAAGAQQPQPLASSPFSRDRHRHAQPLSRGAQPYIGLDAASSGAVAAPGVDAALLLRAGASAGLPARLARLVFSGARFQLSAVARSADGDSRSHSAGGSPAFLWVSPALDVLQWAHDEPSAAQGAQREAGARSVGTPTALVRTVQRGGWHGAPRGSGSAADPYSAKNCAWQFTTDTHTVCLLAQDNAQREDWVTALTLVSKAAARGMLPGPAPGTGAAGLPRAIAQRA